MVHGQVSGWTYNPQEDAFVKCLREFIAFSVERNFSPSITKFLDVFEQVGPDNLVHDYEAWVIKAAIESKRMPTNAGVKYFNRVVAEHIREDGRWVSHMEVSAIRHVLRKCGVTLLPVYSSLADAPNVIEDDEIALINIRGAHYNFVKYTAPPRLNGGRKKQTTTRKKVTKKL